MHYPSPLYFLSSHPSLCVACIIIKCQLGTTALFCFRQYQPKRRQIVIDFEMIEKNINSDIVGPATTSHDIDADIADHMSQMAVSAAATSSVYP